MEVEENRSEKERNYSGCARRFRPYPYKGAAGNVFLRLLSGCPSSRCAARQDQAVSRDGESDFARFDRSLVNGIQHGVQHIAENSGLQAGCIRIDQEEERPVREQKSGPLQEGENAVLYFPDFPFGASAVRRRIHYDRVVVVSSPDLALYKFAAVVHQPADGGVTAPPV